MALVQNTLATQLQNMVPVDTEAEGINNFAAAFETYFYGASVAGIPVNPTSLAGSTTALKSAMVGANSNASLAIQNGIIAFWGVVATAFVTIWTTVPPLIAVVPPTGLNGIQAALNTTFASNISGNLSLSAAASAVAATLHPTQLGGIATLGPPPPGGTPTPIL